MAEEKHKAGFVNIIGNPNVGKSTLMNALVGERISIITSKAQTTRNRIMGIVNGENFQIVYSDTPGVIDPGYKLHEKMMKFVNTAFSDADVLLFVTDITEKEESVSDIISRLEKVQQPVFLLLNKIDLADQNSVEILVESWSKRLKNAKVIPISALEKFNTSAIFDLIIENLPECPPYFPKDQLTDKPERFFVAEILREKVFKYYKKEIPYSVAILIESFKEEEKIIKIRAEIIVERESQKGIIIGHKGKALKNVGSSARRDMENFLQKHVFLETYVKVDKDWRKNDRSLKNFGYNS
ncbi:MAG TPA: GTPase Era [Flavobacteriales bacterium]|nr:GTPase Era [Flavobacteriales bacterium]